MTRRIGPPSNDNEPPQGRRVVNEVPQDMPLYEVELALFERHFGLMIEALRQAAANDDLPGPKGETKP